ncbi:MAG TPA: hypothetical protein VIW92_12320, partial [Thermoanaerobaculia bacterium]
LLTLEAKGFVRRGGPGASVIPLSAIPERASSEPPPARRYHFVHFPQRWAQRLFSKPVLGLATGVIALAMTAVAIDPSLVPRPSALYFGSRRSLTLLILFLWNLLTLFVHEMGHLLAARAIGVPARMGISHRLWILVAETDLTGLWSVPKRQRYLPLLAGAWIDLLSLSLLLLAFRAQESGWILWPPSLYAFARAIAFSYMLRLLWQCFFFVRTDFYYVLITFLGSINLMQNTKSFLRTKVARALPWVRAAAREPLPAAEAKAVRIYAPFYLAGRLLAFWTLFFVTLPFLGHYLIVVARALRTGFAQDPAGFLDSMLLSCLLVGPTLIGLLLWLRKVSRPLLSRWSTTS